MLGEKAKKSAIWIDSDRAGSLTILGHGPRDETTVSYEEIATEASRRASGLAEHGIDRGDAVGLFAQSTLDFVVGCFAIWRRGAVAVSLPTQPRLAARDPWVAQTVTRLRKANARALLLGRDDPKLDFRIETIDMSSLDYAGEFSDEGPSGRDVALIQFSSGSTAQPRGVVIEHRSVISLLEAVERRLGPQPDATTGTFLSWLPLSHDWGLLEFMVRPLWSGRDAVLMPTDLFLESPLRWLEEIGRQGATLSPAPNSAYGFVGRELEKATALSADLSGWVYAGCGGEPVDAPSLERFSAAAARYGFHREAILPGYGLAEATCDVSVASPGSGWREDHVDRAALGAGEAVPARRGTPGVASFVSVGLPMDGIEISVVDSSSERLPERHVGEILVSSPSLMREYLGDPAATAAAFHEGRLKTGDLGYIADGELFITGRLKDIIIVNGRNYHAVDVERVVQSVPGVRKGGCAAIPVVSSGAEGLGVLAEAVATGDEARACRARIARSVLSETGVAPRVVAILAPRTLNKTTSGKLRRADARQRWERGELIDLSDDVRVVAPSRTDDLEERLVAIFEEVLDVSGVDPADDFWDLGGSSLQAGTVVALIEERLSHVVPDAALVSAPSPLQMAALLRSQALKSRPTVVFLGGTGTEALFGVPGAMGRALDLRHLARRIWGEFSFYGFDGRGFDGYRRPYATVEEIAEHYMGLMLEVRPGPYSLLGYSFGGFVAHELANRLQRAGHEVRMLAIVDTIRPRSGALRSPPNPQGLRRTFDPILVHPMRWGYRLLGTIHVNLRTPITRNAWRRFMLERSEMLASMYRPSRYPGRLDYFCAVPAGTEPSIRRLAWWQELADEMVVHDIAGPSHADVLYEPWVGNVAEALIRAAQETRRGVSTEAVIR